ncbi:hypothetical protein TNIN_237781 [Trichonephila inaurata madagascariensis]|uniref:Uncharacterized protein n=1 Tax=Trichonephila inaurata madagascariensis TaxID=2747483 RepID=A0A8X6YWB4_9ARAC|nr:hypothetical protein TNIN_237781 [Trichonephila inaurata madagascariensis]
MAANSTIAYSSTLITSVACFQMLVLIGIVAQSNTYTINSFDPHVECFFHLAFLYDSESTRPAVTAAQNRRMKPDQLLDNNKKNKKQELLQWAQQVLEQLVLLELQLLMSTKGNQLPAYTLLTCETHLRLKQSNQPALSNTSSTHLAKLRH